MNTDYAANCVFLVSSARMKNNPSALPTYAMIKILIITLLINLWNVSFGQSFEQTCYCTRTGFRCLIPADSIDGFKLYKFKKQDKTWEYLGAYKRQEKELEYLEGSSHYPGPPFRIKRITRRALILYEVGCLSCGAVARRRFMKCEYCNLKNFPPFPEM
jgi:hypothetical protein